VILGPPNSGFENMLGFLVPMEVHFSEKLLLDEQLSFPLSEM
jgi:hypothetical protein